MSQRCSIFTGRKCEAVISSTKRVAEVLVKTYRPLGVLRKNRTSIPMSSPKEAHRLGVVHPNSPPSMAPDEQGIAHTIQAKMHSAGSGSGLPPSSLPRPWNWSARICRIKPLAVVFRLGRRTTASLARGQSVTALPIARVGNLQIKRSARSASTRPCAGRRVRTSGWASSRAGFWPVR